MNVRRFEELIEKGDIDKCIDAFEELFDEKTRLEIENSSLQDDVYDLKKERDMLENEIEELKDDVNPTLPWSQALELLDLNRNYIDPFELFEWIDERAVVY